MYRQTKNSLDKHWDFIIVDIFALELSLFLAYLLRNQGRLPIYNELYRNLILIIPLLHIVMAFCINNYSGILRRGYLLELKSVLKQCLGISVVLLMYFFVFQSTDEYSRYVLIGTAVFSVIFVYLGRIGLKALKKHIGKASVSCMLVIAPSDEVPMLLENLQKDIYNRYRISGIVYSDKNAEEGQSVEGIPVVADMSTYKEYVRQQVVDEIFVAVKPSDERMGEIMKIAEEIGVTIHLSIPTLFPTSFPQVISRIGPYTAVTSSPKLVTQTQLFIKRMMDIASALVGLAVTGIAYLFVAPIIKIQAPGPVLFSQTRVGRNGRPFKIYKFRSMYVDAEERKKELMKENEMQGLMFKMENDPRIFPFGRFIRKMSIDELPQFWNVLKGDMSLVGTRPPTMDEYKQYELHHKFRLAFKPGITGMWQVSGRSSIKDFEEVVRLDGEYIRNWSISLDIKIILKTIKVVLSHAGAE